jgi:glycosyltransferase involved in cell wall biosynthesis
MTAPPGISVVMPLYNAGQWVAQSVESVRAQAFSNWELIVVDDGSTDGGPDIVAAAAAKDPRIRLLRQPNAGPAIARNHGVESCRAPWVMLMDSDDLLPPERLGQDLNASQCRPAAPVVVSGTEWFTGDNVPLHQCRLSPDSETDRWRHQFHSVFYFGAMLVRKERYGAVGGFVKDAAFDQIEDYEFTLRVLDQVPFVGEDRIGIRIRKHAQNRSTVARDQVDPQTVEVVRRTWSPVVAGFDVEAAELLFRFWRMEPWRAGLEQLRRVIRWHTQVSHAHLGKYAEPGAAVAVEREWRRRLAWRAAESQLPWSNLISLARVEAAERSAFDAISLMARLLRLRAARGQGS